MKKIFNTQDALPENKRNVSYILGTSGILYVLLLYLLGLHFGFYRATVKFSFSTLINIILPVFLLIIITEYIREKILLSKIKYKRIFSFIFVFIIEILVGIRKCDVTTISGFLALAGNVVFVSIINNLLFNYISIRYGKMPNIIYRLIISLYIFFIPITPDIHILIQTLIKMIFPYIIYVILEYAYSNEHKYLSRKSKRKIAIINFVLISTMIIITMLVSCKFKYGILVIGSESMTGTINKGDSIIYEQYKNQKIKTGQILVFKMDKMVVVHRVIEIKNVNDEKRYYTKGDANEDADQGYTTEDKIIGIYKGKTEKIGYLTLWFNNIFER